MGDPLTVCAFTQGENVPSARFRVRQFIPALARQGIALSESPARWGSYPPGPGPVRLPWLAATLTERAWAAWCVKADVVLFQREMVSTLYTAERFVRTPVVLDVDDAIWLTQRRAAADRLAARSRMVLCGNTFLAEHFASHAPVRVLPTAVDTVRWCPGASPAEPCMVWSGSAGGLPYLQALAPALRRVLAAVPAARLRVVCNAQPVLPGIPVDRIDYLPWSEAIEVDAVCRATVGLMPLPDTPWTRGKCSFKLLTYLACGVPGVASPVGMNRDVIAGGGAFAADSEDAWVDTLVSLLRDPGLAQAAGRAGRAQVAARYALDVIAGQLAAALRDAAT